MSANSLASRSLTVHALSVCGSAEAIAEAIMQAVEAWGNGEEADGVTATVRAGLVGAMDALHHLYKWDAGVLSADIGADAHRQAAKRKARIARDALRQGAPKHDNSILAAVLARMVDDALDVDDLEDIRADLLRIPVPLPLIDPARRWRWPRAEESSTSDASKPRCMLLLSMSGTPVVGPIMVDAGRAYDMTIDARVLDWPEWAHSLRVHFISRWQDSAATVLPVELERPAESDDGLTRATASGGVVVQATPTTPQAPLLFQPEAELVGDDGRSLVIPILGYSELALHAFDPSAHALTGAEALDRHVYEVLVDAGGLDVAESEIREFCELFPVLANEAQKLVANGTFRRGGDVKESEFQIRLLEGAQTRLGANNVATGTDVSGGEMDIVYKRGLTAELKVEKNVTAGLHNAARYLGQPAQYAAGTGRQLAILCVLDLTESESPTGILANDVGILRPALAGLDDPAYPALIGVIIVRGATKLPSGFSRRSVPLDDTESRDSGVR